MSSGGAGQESSRTASVGITVTRTVSSVWVSTRATIQSLSCIVMRSPIDGVSDLTQNSASPFGNQMMSVWWATARLLPSPRRSGRHRAAAPETSGAGSLYRRTYTPPVNSSTNSTMMSTQAQTGIAILLLRY